MMLSVLMVLLLLALGGGLGIFCLCLVQSGKNADEKMKKIRRK